MKGIAFIPARAGSLRVKGKNTREFFGHPLMAYSIQVALQSEIFEDVVVSTDSEETKKTALKYGAQAPFIRPVEFATSTALDIQWITHAFENLKKNYDFFSILRPTSPFRTTGMIAEAFKQFSHTPGIDSIRAVSLCREHPGKMWTISDDGKTMKPFVDQTNMEVALHAKQYQDLPKVYIQNSSLEIAYSKVVWETKSREGKIVAPFLTNPIEGFSIDYEDDWLLATELVKTGRAKLIDIV